MASVRRTPGVDSWQVRYRDPSGHQRNRNFKRRVEADAYAATVEADKLRGSFTDPRLAKTPYREWATQWEATRVNRRASTRARDESYMRNHVLPAFGDRPLGAIQPVDIKAWVAALTTTHAPATVRKAYQLLAASIDAAVNDGLLAKTPCRGIALPKVEYNEMRFLNPAEIAGLADAINPRYRALVFTAAYTGLRAGECAALKLPRLNLLKRQLTVAETLSDVSGHLRFSPPKTKAARRTVTLPASLCDELARHLSQYPAEDLVFTAAMGGPIRWSGFRRRVWHSAIEAASLEGLRFHDLRHTHAALLIAAGEHPKVIQARLGHASIGTTLDTYGHLFEGLDEAAAEKLDATWIEQAVS